MKPARSLVSILFLLCATGAHAQLYKWVGPDGKVSYSDSPPPASAKQLETKASNSAGGSGNANFPFVLSEAVKNHPVVLYTGPKCAPCDSGRALLNARGIPFSEKTVNTNEDIQRLRQAGATQLPLLTIGRNKQLGFEAGTWTGALTAAGYPETSTLPKSYRNPAAEAAAPLPTKTVANKQSGEKAIERPADDSPPAVGNAPPGFRF